MPVVLLAAGIGSGDGLGLGDSDGEGEGDALGDADGVGGTEGVGVGGPCRSNCAHGLGWTLAQM